MKNMNNTLKIFFAAGLLLALGCNSCKQKPADNGADYTISPEAGTTYKAGDVVKVKVGLPADTKPDSVVYLMEETRLGVAKDSSAISVKTDTIPLGIKLITAKVYQAGKSRM
jgi:beta-lactam-binding protein with PASTA domain